MKSLSIIEQNSETIIGKESLENSLKSKKPLKIKLGVDPTRPDLTLGHLVVFNKLRQFQEMGHQAIVIIGDFTTLIGDPSGRSSTRPTLTKNQIKQNAETYLSQAFKILDKKKTKVHYNSEWFNKMNFEDCLKLARKMTVARMLEREDFSKRYKSNTPISIIEFLYPLIQGYDSLVLKSDVEIGGSDQLFNMLVGRALQKDANAKEQSIITMPLLVGLDGIKKMSKSLDNYVAFSDTPKDMFGKIMSISDNVMWDYYKLLLLYDVKEINKLKNEHPMKVKKDLAKLLVERFHSKDVASFECNQFEEVFSKNNNPESMPSYLWKDFISESKNFTILDLMHETKLFESKGSIRRLIIQGAVKINGVKVSDGNKAIENNENELIFQAGKRIFFKVS